MVQHLYLVGGQQRDRRPLSAATNDWYEYQKALVLALDVRSREATPVIEYVSPPEACPTNDATILFKSGTLWANQLYVCTQTEILVYCLPTLERIAYISLPLFNDVHHVLPTEDGTLLVANSGLDMVVELSHAGAVLQLWNVLGEDPWARFSPAIDYRRVRSTKPHLAHPNYVFRVGDDIWATRFEQRDAICLTTSGRRIDIGIQRVHDGVAHEGLLYFTTVDGHIVAADPHNCAVVDVIDLNAMHTGNAQLGWCRSLAFDGDHVWVGFSRLRPTRFRENVSWALHGFKRSLGTHVACYDLRRRECLTQIFLEPFGMNAVFGIFPANGRAAG